jgi:dTMP kinase
LKKSRANIPEILDRFVVFEGLDGSGTTTQADKLASFLVDHGYPVFRTSEPTDGAVGGFLRSVLRGKLSLDPLTVAYLFAADRAEHVHDANGGIRSRAAAGDWVISDRYLYSSLAYQSVDVDYNTVWDLNSHFPHPRHVIFLDVPVSECSKRLAGRPSREIYEYEAFQERALEHYERAFRALPPGVELHRMDGTGDIGSLSRRISTILENAPI